MDENSYIGITMGPISKTISAAETPAMLWYASFMFSTLTERICRQLTSCGIEILCPYYDGIERGDGVGRYHDRIIVKSSDTELVSKCIESGKNEICEIIVSDLKKRGHAGDYRGFLQNFFCIHWVRLTVGNGENSIIKLGARLDALEQMPSFNSLDDCNPFKLLFKGESEDSNSFIRYSDLLPKNATTNTQLFSTGREGVRKFKSIPEIAVSDGDKSKYKKYSYYAVVQADGDGMGNYLAMLPNDKIKGFSEACFDYVSEAVRLIGEYGGMTIYAGGDDLLFISPIESAAGTVFELCQKLRDKFKSKISDKLGDGGLTLSLGVSVRYENYPFYETLAAAGNALFVKSKSILGKNTVTVDFSKHSGQSALFCIPCEELESFNALMSQSCSVDEDSVNSIIYILTSFSAMFKAASGDSKTIRNILINQYDNDTQKKYLNYIESISKSFTEFYTKLNSDRHISLCDDSEQINDEQREIKCYESILRLGKFMVEGGHEND